MVITRTWCNAVPFIVNRTLMYHSSPQCTMDVAVCCRKLHVLNFHALRCVTTLLIVIAGLIQPKCALWSGVYEALRVNLQLVWAHPADAFHICCFFLWMWYVAVSTLKVKVVLKPFFFYLNVFSALRWKTFSVLLPPGTPYTYLSVISIQKCAWEQPLYLHWSERQ